MRRLRDGARAASNESDEVNGQNTSADSVGAIHLDAVGGIAGDMFAAACLDALPGLWQACEAAVMQLAPPAQYVPRLLAHSDGILCGRRFEVEEPPAPGSQTEHGGHHHGHSHGHGHGHHHDHDHHHASWRDIRGRLTAAGLPPRTTAISLAIFSRLAEAEAKVHGIVVDEVQFHEVGAWDSIIDIVAAASIIAQLDGCRWTVGVLPRGRGMVRTAHGMLPVPAPATVELLQGFILRDDGEEGERITPTGAAILNHLRPSQAADFEPRTLLGSGIGFGTRKLSRRSNILRATLYGQASPAAAAECIEVLRCEIDDQSPEDLAIALEHVRSDPDVIDVCQWPVYAKKGRIAVALQVLARSGSGEKVSGLLCDETTTLGVRRSVVARHALARHAIAEEDGIRVKQAKRSHGLTAKAESDDLADVRGHDARARLAAAAVKRAMDGGDRDND